MSFSALPPDVQHIANELLTRKQLDVWKLHLAGCSLRRSARMLGVSKSTVTDHLDAAHGRLAMAGVRMDRNRYYLEEAA